jgi:hypothetical protein
MAFHLIHSVLNSYVVLVVNNRTNANTELTIVGVGVFVVVDASCSFLFLLLGYIAVVESPATSRTD